MKDIVEKILAYLPQYLAEFAEVFSGPKKFIGERNTDTDISFNNALVFLGISIALSVIMTAPLLPVEKDIWQHLVSQAVGAFLGVALASLALRLAWFAMGGKASVKSFFVAYAYYTGVMIVLITFFTLLGEGFFKALEPEMYTEARAYQINKSSPPDFGNSKIPFISLGIIIFGILITSVWGVIGWGVYRRLNGLSKLRSFGALLLMAPFGWLIGSIVFFVITAMS